MAGTTATTPNDNQTSSETSAPVSSTNGISRSPRCPPMAPKASPPTKAAMKPLPCNASAQA